jgi:hypothetical protein
MRGNHASFRGIRNASFLFGFMDDSPFSPMVGLHYKHSPISGRQVMCFKAQLNNINLCELDFLL